MMLGSPPTFDGAAVLAARLMRAALGHGLPPGVVLNMNFPPGPQYKGVRITRQGWSVYRDQLVERRDPRGRPYYWIGGEVPIGRHEEEGTDFWALAQGYVSITPLRPDLTARDALPELERWNLTI
jgi:5'-nucleotidase